MKILKIVERIDPFGVTITKEQQLSLEENCRAEF